jgi:hypothetical protein
VPKLKSEAEDSEAQEEDGGTLAQISKAAALLVGTLYTAGLIIVNLDLARYGIVNFELARPEYITIGALWLLLSIGVVAVVENARENLWNPLGGLQIDWFNLIFSEALFGGFFLLFMGAVSGKPFFSFDGGVLVFLTASPLIGSWVFLRKLFSFNLSSLYEGDWMFSFRGRPLHNFLAWLLRELSVSVA